MTTFARSIRRATGAAIVFAFVATAHLSRPPALAASAAQAAPAPKGNPEKGQMLFKTNGCFQCHGAEAQGGTAGPRLGPEPLPFARLAAYVRAPRGEMPPYTAKVMSEQDLADVYAFLQARPRPPAVGTIPLLAP